MIPVEPHLGLHVCEYQIIRSADTTEVEKGFLNIQEKKTVVVAR